jgi:non-specific serine/threonine protein kinase
MSRPNTPDPDSHPRVHGGHRQARPVAGFWAGRRSAVPQTRARLGHMALAERPAQHNLPAELSSLVGRERDLAALRPLLESRASRLLTLTGPGGVGKTRLSLRLGSIVADAFREGVWLVELAGVADPDLVPETVATTLGVRGAAGVEIDQSLVGALRARQVLLILDNCEHLLAATAALATTLLRRCPNLSIVATSRESLGVTGEVNWPVRSLSLPTAQASFDEVLGSEAVELFAQRARAADPDFSLTQANAPSLIELCRRLDGLPLALELAAAAVSTLSIDQLTARLTTRLDVLTGGPSIPARHQTLTAALNWSYDLLSEREQLLLRRLSVFSGGWTLEVVESVCADDALEAAQVVQLLRRLAARSLVAVEVDAAGSVRYRLLEIVRAFAIERQAQSGENARLRARHFDALARLAERLEPRLHGPDQAQFANLLERELDNLRSALDWAFSGNARQRGLRLATSLRYFWFMRGHLREGADRLRQGLESGAAADDAPLRALALCALGFLLTVRGEHAEARTQLEAALSIGLDRVDVSIIGFANRYLGLIAVAEARYADARTLLEESLRRFRGINSAEDMALALMYLGDVALHQKNTTRAQRLFEESQTLLEQLQNRTVLPYPLRRLGQLARQRGDLRLAARLCLESLAHNREVGEQQGVAASLVGMALVAEARGQPLTAAQLLGKAEALLSAFGAGLLPFDEQELQLARERVRSQMEREAWAAALVSGGRLSLDDAEHAVEELAEEPPPAVAGLTARQTEILRMVALGHTNREIAASLSLSLATVERHLANIYAKIGARGRADATLYAARSGLLTPER